MNYLVHNLDSLEKLRKDKNIKYGIRKINIELPENNDVKLYERRLNKHYFACGCQEGAISVYISLFGSLLTCWILKLNILSNWWRILIVMAIAALIGKLFGLIYSNFKLKRTFQNLAIYFK